MKSDYESALAAQKRAEDEKKHQEHVRATYAEQIANFDEELRKTEAELLEIKPKRDAKSKDLSNVRKEMSELGSKIAALSSKKTATTRYKTVAERDKGILFKKKLILISINYLYFFGRSHSFDNSIRSLLNRTDGHRLCL